MDIGTALQNEVEKIREQRRAESDSFWLRQPYTSKADGVVWAVFFGFGLAGVIGVALFLLMA